MTVCLFFDNMDDNGTNVGGDDITPQKIVYSPIVDNFETFQAIGLYEHFKDHIAGELSITAMANGIRSRPVIFKKNLEVAQILNLVIVLDEGKVH